MATDGTVYDLSGVTTDIDAAFLSGGGIERTRQALDDGGLPQVTDPHQQRVGPPVASPGKIVGIGLNYLDHAAESGACPPNEPIAFLKPSDTVVGPEDDVVIPPHSTKTDHEVELAVVIGSTARYLSSTEEARRSVAGYTVANDVSEREFQLERGGQWEKGKSCETFTPLGPWLVTGEDADAAQADVRLWVNGALVQSGNTSNMIFGVEYLVYYLSHFMVLHPGDVVITGTPAGVAMGRPGQPYLRPGDTMELAIDGLGRQRQQLVAA
ncbi:fumarylacetoacetate hydrolase family protein [Haloactinospora alba]|nr:fumarylacetoacetate hydrolase family protein [Haloactinospora alba]